MGRDVKKCKQCGQFRGIEEFRVYYNRNKSKPPGRYRLCKTCESINQRYKYLTTKLNKDAISPAENKERLQIEEMYVLLEDAGLEPPRRKQDIASAVPDLVSGIMSAVSQQLEKREEAGVELDTPDELLEWLDKDLSIYNPDQLDDIYDKLRDKHNPTIGLDQTTLLPVRADTNRDALDRIADRFEEYGDNYEW